MRVKFLPEGEMRVKTPITIEIDRALQKPMIDVQGIGPLKVIPGKNVDQYSAEFYTQHVGEYKVKIFNNTETKYEIIEISDPDFFSISPEAGYVFVAFMAVSFGLYKWIKKLLKRKKPSRKL